MNEKAQPSAVSLKILKALNKTLLKRQFRKKQNVPVKDTHIKTNEEKLVDITTGSQDMLITATTVFPFVFFPDTISVGRQQLTIIHRGAFSSANTISVQIDDIQNVESNIGPFMGSLHLFSKYFTNNVRSINYLSRSDVVKIQRIIQGYMIAHKRKIDCSTIEKEQLIVLLNDLGQVAGV